MVGQVDGRLIVEFDHLADVHHRLGELLLLAELLVGEVQVGELDALERRNLAFDRLLVGHHRRDQVIEIDILDVEVLADGDAAVAQDTEHLGPVGDRVEMGLDGVRIGRDQAQSQGGRENLDENRFHRKVMHSHGRPVQLTTIQEGEMTEMNNFADKLR